MNKFLLAGAALLLGIVAVSECRKHTCAEYTQDDADALFEKEKGGAKKEWKELNKKHGNKFPNEKAEEAHRRNLYRKAAKEITKQNKKNGGKFCLRLNKFSTMDDDERKDYLGGPQKGSVPDGGSGGNGNQISKRSLPTSLFYPSGDVGSQASCGSCSMWSSLHALNGFLTKSQGKTVELSEKQLIDCWDRGGVNYDCSGVWPYWVYDHFKTRLPVEKHAYAPYTLPPGECQTPTSGEFVSSWVRHSSGVTDDQIMQMLQDGPVVTAFDVSTDYYSYSQGILDKSSSATCTVGSHAVAIVGYGSEDGVDYFVVKNSWGYGWGEKGYFRVERLGGATTSGQRYCNWGWLATQPTLSGAMPHGYDANHVVTSTQTLPAYIGSSAPTTCCVTVFEHSNFDGNSKQFCGQIDWIGYDWNDIISSLKVDAGCKATLYEHSYYDGVAWGPFEGDVDWVGDIVNDQVSGLTVE